MLELTKYSAILWETLTKLILLCVTHH